MNDADPDKKPAAGARRRAKSGGPSPYDEHIPKIRHALRDRQRYEKGRNSEDLTDVELAADIEAYTGVKMGSEVVRRFIGGYYRDPVTGRVIPPKPRNLKAIVDYLTQPEVGALSPEALTGRDDQTVAARKLAAYLMQDFDQGPATPPRSLEGAYRAIVEVAGRRLVRHLTLEIPHDDGVILVRAKEYPSSAEGDDAPKEGAGVRESRGWAVFTPEDYLLFFMKDLARSTNHYYFGFGQVSDFYSREAVDCLLLVRQDDVNELSDRDSADLRKLMQESSLEVASPLRGLAPSIVKKTAGNPHLFQRVVLEFSKKKEKEAIMSSDSSDDKSSPEESGSGLKLKRSDRGGEFFKKIEDWRPQGAAEQRDMDQRIALGRQLIEAANSYDAERAATLIERGALVNYRDPRTGETALHIAAETGNRPLFRVLIASGQCDHLIRDRQGRLASELADLFGDDTAMARLLMSKEAEQGRTKGVEPRLRVDQPIPEPE